MGRKRGRLKGETKGEGEEKTLGGGRRQMGEGGESRRRRRRSQQGEEENPMERGKISHVRRERLFSENHLNSEELIYIYIWYI